MNTHFLITDPRKIRWIIACLGAAFLIAGCSEAKVDPRFVEATEIRNARNERIISDFREREAQSDKRLAWYTRLLERSRDRHAENRKETDRRIAKMIKREREDRPQMVQHTLDQFAEKIAGHPEAIDDDIPELFY